MASAQCACRQSLARRLSCRPSMWDGWSLMAQRAFAGRHSPPPRNGMSLSTRRLRKLQLPTCAPCCCRTSFATGEESTSPNGRTSITPDVYLKVCEQSRPTINADFILFDEAQDSDGLMLSVLKHQRTQVIYVGDPYQQIYEWRGAVNAMEHITAPQCALTESFR